MANAAAGVWATRVVCLMLIITTVFSLATVGQELVSGVTVSTNKWGPKVTNTLSAAPLKYWASVGSHLVFTFVLGALSVGAFWLARLESPPQHSKTIRKAK